MKRVAAIQMASGPNVRANLTEAGRLISQAVDTGAELMVLPENFAIMGMQEEDKVKVRVGYSKSIHYEYWVGKETWENIKYILDKKTGYPKPEVAGTFTQLPLKAAWAVTIHKSQGKTFEKAAIDMGRGAFAHGQAYVALSRVRRLSGLILKRPLKASDIILDKAVHRFMNQQQ